MLKQSVLFALGLIILAGGAGPASAQPASDDACNRFAAEGVSRYNRARTSNCDLKGSQLTGDYSRLFNACRTWQFPRVQSEAQTLAAAERLACQRKVVPGQGAGTGRPTASNAPYQIRWVQVGGNWQTGWGSTKTPTCGHGAAGSFCGPAENWRGQYAHGAQTKWRRGGCSNPVMTIQCEVRRTP